MYNEQIKKLKNLLNEAEVILFTYLLVIAGIVLIFKANHKKDGGEIPITIRDIIIGLIIAVLNSAFSWLYYKYSLTEQKCCCRREDQVRPES